MQNLEAAHKERQRDLIRLRAHARDLAKNNAYMRRYVGMVSTHIVGAEGIKLESAVLGNLKKPKEALNDQIEDAWEAWGKSVTVDGRLSWCEFQHLVAETVATDGEVLIRMVPGYKNACRFALEIIDADRLDWTYNVAADQNGVRVIMGVEVDQWGVPQAYWLWTTHPYDYEGHPRRMRVPAAQILHIYTEERCRATRGIPWAVPCMVQLNMLGRLWTSELAAANAEADRLGIIKTQAGLDNLDDAGDPSDAATQIQTDLASFIGLDPGLDVVFPNLQHPNSAFPEFTKALLKGIAASLGVAYHSLAADVSDANYSSARVALLDERDTWRRLQAWFIRNVCAPIYANWLEMALASGALQVVVADPSKICCPQWWPRTWEWIDPKNDIQASILAIRSGLSTYQKELGNQGLDWRETFRQRKEEEGYQVELGLHLELDMAKGSTTAPSDPADLEDAIEPGTPAAKPTKKGAPDASA